MDNFVPCLWFDTEAKQAAEFYVSVFPNSRILAVTHYSSTGPRPEGTVLTAEFELDGKRFLALNAGPEFSFSPAISFQVFCETQEEVDSYWSKLSAGGEEGNCGWLTDRYGLSWQIVPRALAELLSDSDPARAARVTAALMQMNKLEIAALERAVAGE